MACVALWPLIKATVVALNLKNNCYNDKIYVNLLILESCARSRES